MRNILILTALICFNSVAFEKEKLLINGKWDCSPEPSSEMVLVNTIEYRFKDMSFTHFGRVTFIQSDGLESTLESESVGAFKYEPPVIEYNIDSIDIKIIEDKSGFLEGVEESLKKAMLAKSAPLIIKPLNDSHWLQINSETNEVTECKKI